MDTGPALVVLLLIVSCLYLVWQTLTRDLEDKNPYDDKDDGK